MKTTHDEDRARQADRLRTQRATKHIRPTCAITCGKYPKAKAHLIKCDNCRDRKICMWEH